MLLGTRCSVFRGVMNEMIEVKTAKYVLLMCYSFVRSSMFVECKVLLMGSWCKLKLTDWPYSRSGDY